MTKGVNIGVRTWVLTGMLRVLMARCMLTSARMLATTTTATTTTTGSATAHERIPSYSKKVGAGILTSFLFGKIFNSTTQVAGAKGSVL